MPPRYTRHKRCDIAGLMADIPSWTVKQETSLRAFFTLAALLIASIVTIFHIIAAFMLLSQMP